MTISEKILAAHAGLEQAEPGQLINAKLDLVLANDITGPVSIREMRQYGFQDVYDPERIVLIPDHFAPPKDIPSAALYVTMRDFAREKGIVHYYEAGQCGIEHCFLPESGLVSPGDLIIGGDSHTCTYGALGAFATGVGNKDLTVGMATGEAWFRAPETMLFILTGKPKNPWVSGKDYILAIIGQIGVDGAQYRVMEFRGEAVAALSMDGRMTVCNMAIEAGAKTGVVAPDDKTLAYVRGRVKRPWKVYDSDPDARYERVTELNTENMRPLVDFPHLPSNIRDVEEAENISIDQVVIGSCTNGRMEDLRTAAVILKGRRVHPYVRVVVLPGSQAIYTQAIREGLIEIFVDAGCAVSTPTCGPCLGGYMGILDKGERCVSTTNRNFVGRMGHPESQVYLSNPAVAAASAVAGHIADPREVVCDGNPCG
jgi:3-isopropylmalate/(R)-2-methylmalate dehydratase large subunit